MSLPAYTSVGSYPLYYITKLDKVACNCCADDLGLNSDHGHVAWEGDAIECDYCSTLIETAYGRAEQPDERTDEDLRESAE